MKNFVEKYGAAASLCAWFGTVLSIGAGYMICCIRHDKRQIKTCKKLEEVYQAEIDYYKSITN